MPTSSFHQIPARHDMRKASLIFGEYKRIMCELSHLSEEEDKLKFRRKLNFRRERRPRQVFL